ncbi:MULTISPECIES: ABC transporter substrate-binding protein [Sanguibacter]|uniref:Extracellular solute-binding protein n=1 Tax=Sanguibacter inulinus TaxID=60922 RepID=A0A853EVW4_9MICO|nr:MULTISPECIES: extracellular solute-binding protein [Sanguibacter]KQT96567.1 sugar ABC transporter substrate-binding protein [Sanguibacter sp. Leaf3]MBF0723544.1 extracellular solute-binding protein [Sanguibacter inulinus]NYS94689.1 extracellular solute-binding protein [Sanguibacter inulinus]
MRLARTRLTAAAVTIAALTLGVAACGSDSDSASGDGPVNLTFWTWAPEMEAVVDIWNEANPDIQVTVNKQDGGDAAVTKLLTAIKAGSGAPDIMQAEYQAIPTMVSADALADVSAEVGDDLSGHFADGVWNSVTLGTDAVYGIPQDSGPMQFYYRADIFEDMGLAVPTTWDEYADVAAQLHTADPSKYLGTFSATDAGSFTGLAQQAGASWWGIDGESWTVDIDDEATLKVAQYWGDLVEAGTIDNKPMYTPEWNAALNDGSQVGWLSAVWAPGVLAGNAPDTEGLWKMAPMPQWDASAPATGNWGGSATAVTTQSEHAEQAVEFITWMNTSEEGVAALADVSGIYPADIPGQSTALTDPPAFFANQPDFYEIVAETAGTANPFTYGPNVNVAYSAFNDAFGKAAESRSAAGFVEGIESMQTTTVEDLKNSGFSVAE